MRRAALLAAALAACGVKAPPRPPAKAAARATSPAPAATTPTPAERPPQAP